MPVIVHSLDLVDARRRRDLDGLRGGPNLVGVYPKRTDSSRPTSRVRGPHQESIQTTPTGLADDAKHRASWTSDHPPLHDPRPGRRVCAGRQLCKDTRRSG